MDIDRKDHRMTHQAAGIDVPLKVIIVSDAAPSRNGVGAYYQDLFGLLEPELSFLEMVCPVIVNDKWEAGLVLPLPGDKTQKLCFPNYWKMKSRLKQVQPDILVVATPGVYGLCAAHLAVALKIPFVTGFHTSFEHLTELYWGDSLRAKVVEKYFKISNGYLLKRTDLVLGNSASILEQATRMGAGLTRQIGTPLAGDFLATEPPAHSGEIGKLLFAGRLAKEKNIDAITDAARENPDLHFSIAGDGPLRGEVEAAAQVLDNLNYLGWLDRSNLRQVMDEHDVLILPSHYETFGTIALEAMAREKVVIVSSGCGISLWPSLTPGLKIIDQNENLSSTLKQLKTDAPESHQALAREARQRALSLNNNVREEWLTVFSDVLGSRV